MRQTTVAILTTLLISHAIHAEAVRKRALLVGINDYSASTLPARPGPPPPPRGWSNLDGAVTDVEIMRGLLVELYGFKPGDIVTLIDQQATQKAIGDAIDTHLVKPAKQGDVVLFFYSGHGSQVRNNSSSEADKLDESLVPADSRLGAEDIRDKQLRLAFNSILDKKARLTVIFDACHSGSGARGLDGGPRHRAVSPDLRDVADPYDGPRPEDRGALILSATQDFDLAYETLDGDGKIHGAFSWALARAMRDAEDGEAASDTFLRAQARLRADIAAQDPVLAGLPEARLAPLFDERGMRRKQRALLAVEKMTATGTYLLRGGWLNGITVGSELRVPGHKDARLEIVALRGISGSEARLRGTGSLPSGTLVEVVSWAAPLARPLRVWVPRDAGDALADAKKLREEAARRGIRWVVDTTVETPTHQLRRQKGTWELITGGRVHRSGATIADVPDCASLFVQLPVPAQLDDAIGMVDGVVRTQGPETADYILTGRLASDRIEYAWVKPLVSEADRKRVLMPMRTAWQEGSSAALLLKDAAARLRKVHGWQELTAPGTRPHYQLAIKRADNGALVTDGFLAGLRRYRLVLRARAGDAAPVFARYVHVFVIDSHGNSTLLFPMSQTGSVENLLPVTPTPGEALRNPPAEIQLPGIAPFEVAAPYGKDSFFVLTTDVPLPTLASLEWDGVRSPTSTPRNAIEELLAQTLSGERTESQAAPPIRTPPNWSIEKFVFESVPPKRGGS